MMTFCRSAKSMVKSRTLGSCFALVVICSVFVSLNLLMYVTNYADFDGHRTGHTNVPSSTGDADRTSVKLLNRPLPYVERSTAKKSNAEQMLFNSTNDAELLLTLFTTFQNSATRRLIHLNTIISWSSLAPFGVRLILYVTVDMDPVGGDTGVDQSDIAKSNDEQASSVVAEARRRGWMIRRCPVMSPNNVPVLRHMFLDAESISRSTFYGYANADILFDSDLPRTLFDIQSQLNRLRRQNTRGLLVIGVRTDCVVNSQSVNASDRAVKTRSTIVDHRRPFSESHLGPRSRYQSRASRGKGAICSPEPVSSSLSSSKFLPSYSKMHANVVDIQGNGTATTLTSAQDYFITVRSGLPWYSIPDLVVGRAGVDNWLLVTALTGNAVVVDASGTVTARHQVPPGYRPSAHYDRRPGPGGGDDGLSNYRLIGQFDYSLGLTNCAPLYTAFVDVAQRDVLSRSSLMSLEGRFARSHVNDIPTEVDEVIGFRNNTKLRTVVKLRELNRYCKRAYLKRRINPRNVFLYNRL